MSKKRNKSVVSTKATLHKKYSSGKKNKKEKKQIKKKQKHSERKLTTGLNEDEVSTKLRVKKKVKKTSKSPLKITKKKVKLSKKKQSNELTKDKPTSFGAASSDSEPEAIDADWEVNDTDAKYNSWQDANSDSDIKSHQVTSELSDDLEESESDHDEELDETELNSLLSSDRKREHSSSEEELTNESNTTDEDDSVVSDPMDSIDQKPNTVLETKRKDKTSSVQTNPPARFSPSTAQDKSTVENTDPSSSLTLNDEQSLMTEIRRRAMDLASRSLYISPVPPDCSLERLKQLSPDVVSCRLSYNPIKKNCRNYAFLEYQDAAAASAAQKFITGRLFAGRNVSAQPGRPQVTLDSGAWDQIDRRRLFISGLHPGVTRADLQHVFPKAELDYPFHSAGFPLGYAVAKFVNETVAFESFVKAHQRPIRGQAIFINYVMQPPKLNKSAGSTAKPTTAFPSKGKNDPSDVATQIKSDGSLSETKQSSTIVNHNPTPSETLTVNSKKTVSVVPEPVAANKPKVLIQPIMDVEGSDEDDKAEAEDLFTKLGKFDQMDSGDFLRKSQTASSKPTNILHQLLSSKKHSKPDPSAKASKSLIRMTEDSDESESEEHGSPGEKEESEASDEDDSTSSDENNDTDDTENSNDGEEEESIEGTDDDDNADNDEDEESEDDPDEASTDEQSVDESNTSEGSTSRHETSVLFKRPPTASERAALRSKPEPLDEKIDETLRAVMHSRRTAMRAVKTAGSKRPWMSAGQGSKKQQKSALAKSRKPFELPVPSKRQKL